MAAFGIGYEFGSRFLISVNKYLLFILFHYIFLPVRYINGRKGLGFSACTPP